MAADLLQHVLTSPIGRDCFTSRRLVTASQNVFHALEEIDPLHKERYNQMPQMSQILDVDDLTTFLSTHLATRIDLPAWK